MARDRLHFLFLNIGHFMDHLLMLVFATVAALALWREWGMGYAELVPYAAPGFVAFGAFSLPAGWIADRWSRDGMMAVFFTGIGLAAVVTGLARTPFELALGLFAVGVFAAIYHPVGLALVVGKYARTGMALGINGVWGNLGVGSAALITGYFIDNGGWRAAFIVPGVVSLLLGIAYAWLFWPEVSTRAAPIAKAAAGSGASTPARNPDLLRRVTAIIIFTILLSGLIFQSTTFALPKVFEERLQGIASSATLLGWLAFIVFGIGSAAQVVTGALLDRFGPRIVFMCVAAIQTVFFAVMPGLSDWAALIVAVAFMLGAFGQVPINDYMIARMAKTELRASVYGARFVVTAAVFAATLPFIAWVHRNWGFDVLFQVLAAAALLTLLAVALLPRRLPEPAATAAPAGGTAAALEKA